MILTIIIILCIFVCTYLYYKKEIEMDSYNIINVIFFAPLFSLLGIFVIAGISTVISSQLKYELHSYSFPINSLKDNLVSTGTINGNIFVVSGYINQDINYFYSVNTKYGEKIEHIPSTNTYIKYDDRVEPNIIVYYWKKEKPPQWLNYITFVGLLNDNKRHLDHYEIIVPERTIRCNDTYEIDME